MNKSGGNNKQRDNKLLFCIFIMHILRLVLFSHHLGSEPCFGVSKTNKNPRFFDPNQKIKKNQSPLKLKLI